MGDNFFYGVLVVPELLETMRANMVVVMAMVMTVTAVVVNAVVVNAVVVKVMVVKVVVGNVVERMELPRHG